jgi:hypothetical protein
VGAAEAGLSPAADRCAFQAVQLPIVIVMNAIAALII